MHVLVLLLAQHALSDRGNLSDSDVVSYSTVGWGICQANCENGSSGCIGGQMMSSYDMEGNDPDQSIGSETHCQAVCSSLQYCVGYNHGVKFPEIGPPWMCLLYMYSSQYVNREDQPDGFLRNPCSHDCCATVPGCQPNGVASLTNVGIPCEHCKCVAKDGTPPFPTENIEPTICIPSGGLCGSEFWWAILVILVCCLIGTIQCGWNCDKMLDCCYYCIRRARRSTETTVLDFDGLLADRYGSGAIGGQPQGVQ